MLRPVMQNGDQLRGSSLVSRARNGVLDFLWIMCIVFCQEKDNRNFDVSSWGARHLQRVGHIGLLAFVVCKKWVGGDPSIWPVDRQYCLCFCSVVLLQFISPSFVAEFWVQCLCYWFKASEMRDRVVLRKFWFGADGIVPPSSRAVFDWMITICCISSSRLCCTSPECSAFTCWFRASEKSRRVRNDSYTGSVFVVHSV